MVAFAIMMPATRQVALKLKYGMEADPQKETFLAPNPVTKKEVSRVATGGPQPKTSESANTPTYPPRWI